MKQINIVLWVLRICLIWSMVEGCFQWMNFPNSSPSTTPPHILRDKKFWDTYADEVLNKKTWKCFFPEDILKRNLEKDAQLYDDSKLFLERRRKVNDWRKNDTLWAFTIYQASLELAYEDKDGKFSRELRTYGLLDALEDFLYHIHYFREVAKVMSDRGEPVLINSQHSSTIHDIDKLDPVMLVAYSERFEDNKTTSLWDECVYRHTHINPHHQSHCLWQNCCKHLNATQCDVEGKNALKEMICDKVSRRLQKTLGGKMSNDIWNVELAYYNGLPERWLSRAEMLMNKMKNWKE